MKFRNVFWGLFFILAAALVIVSQLGYITGISLFSLLCTIFLVAALIQSIVHFSITGTLFSIAFLVIIFAEPLGIASLAPWAILGAAFLASLGLSIIIHPRKLFRHSGRSNHEEGFETIVNDPDESEFSFQVQLGSGIKYINTDDLQKGRLGCSFGAMKVYFDNAHIASGNATIEVDFSCSAVELYIPKEWKVVNCVGVSLGAIEEKNRALEETKAVLTLTGRASLSGVEIIYI